MATMDALVGGRPAAGRPDAACRRVRAAPRGQRRRRARRTATCRATTRRAWPRRPMPPRRGAGASSSRAPARSSPRRTAARPSPRSRTRPSPAAGPATSWPGAIGSLLAQGLDPFDAARLGVYLHGLAGDAGRERFGDAGLLASDLPDGLAVARKRLAAIAERKNAGKRLGFTLGTSSAAPAGAAAPPSTTPGEPR